MKIREIRWNWVLATFSTGMIGLSFMAYQGLLPKIISEIPLGDKIGHFFLIGSLGLLTHKAMEHRKISLAAGPLIITALSIMDECMQSLSSMRSFSSGDIAANLAGIWILYLLYEFSKKMHSSNSPNPTSAHSVQAFQGRQITKGSKK